MLSFDPVPATILSDDPCHLGEGPGYDRRTNKAWWFDILGQVFFLHDFGTGSTTRHPLPFMGSQASLVDDRHHLVAADAGFFLCDFDTGAFRHIADLEADKGRMRSNDGRSHPSGSLWIGTMGRKAEADAGSIYWFRGGELRRLFSGITIPNAICFSPDGATGYFTDTIRGQLMHVPLDPATGLPTGEASVLHDSRGENAGLDGAVVDADGQIWVARWGGACVSAFDPSGRLLRNVAVPARQASCPAFVGPDLDRMLVTSAYEGMDEAARAADPKAGSIFLLDFPMKGREDPRVVL